jgi:hypothetical protein
MDSFSRRYGLGVAPHEGMSAPIHDISVMKDITMTPEAIELLVDDLEGLRGMVPGALLNQWQGDLAKARANT